jgi:indolepyruvate ferredoxin oxidoreductase beta subunit
MSSKSNKAFEGDKMTVKEINILIAGVGGQGAITTSSILARAAMERGMNVITAETHGMAQRGGSVEVHVRMGDVYAPLIPLGSATFVVSLEAVEALRYAAYMTEKTAIILNSKTIRPRAGYPDFEEILKRLEGVAGEITVVNATTIAEKVAVPQATNVVMTGMLAKKMERFGFELQNFEDALREIFPDKLRDINLRALKAGYGAME